MFKLIVGVFVVLGFAFFQMSGGSNFDPEALRQSRIEIVPLEDQPLQTIDSLALSNDHDDIFEEAEVTRASFDLNTPVETIQAVDETPEDVVLPSLIANNASVIGETQDIRKVKGTRVNVRGGPGTQFGVVGKLTQDTEVVILKAQDNGWLEMRTTDGKTVGWIADFLLTKG